MKPIDFFFDAADHTRHALRLDIDQQSVFLDGALCPLTCQEFTLLLALIRRPDQPISRADLLNALWGPAVFVTRTVDVYIQRLRKKLPLLPIETIYRVGYMLSSRGSDS